VDGCDEERLEVIDGWCERGWEREGHGFGYELVSSIGVRSGNCGDITLFSTLKCADMPQNSGKTKYDRGSGQAIFDIDPPISLSDMMQQAGTK